MIQIDKTKDSSTTFEVSFELALNNFHPVERSFAGGWGLIPSYDGCTIAFNADPSKHSKLCKIYDFRTPSYILIPAYTSDDLIKYLKNIYSLYPSEQVEDFDYSQNLLEIKFQPNKQFQVFFKVNHQKFFGEAPSLADALAETILDFFRVKRKRASCCFESSRPQEKNEQ